MKISVIISNFNGAKFLPRLLETLARQTDVESEIIVVDRQSRDESGQILQAHPSVLVVSEPPETGLVSGYHRGTLEATGELLFFCNEDMWFEPDCLSRMAAQIDLSQRVGIVDPWQWTYDGQELIHAGIRFRPAKWDVNSPYPRRKIEFLYPLDSGQIVPLPCAGAVLIHRQVYEEIGGWDGSFFLNDEDTDLGIRAWQAGWKCVTEPHARVFHAVGSANSKTIPNLAQSVGQRRYISTFANKAIIGVKYFEPAYQFTILCAWLLRVLNNLRRGRWNFFRWDFLVLQEFWRRRAAAEATRKKFPRRVGAKFFLAPEFQAPCP